MDRSAPNRRHSRSMPTTATMKRKTTIACLVVLPLVLAAMSVIFAIVIQRVIGGLSGPNIRSVPSTTGFHTKNLERKRTNTQYSLYITIDHFDGRAWLETTAGSVLAPIPEREFFSQPRSPLSRPYLSVIEVDESGRYYWGRENRPWAVSEPIAYFILDAAQRKYTRFSTPALQAAELARLGVSLESRAPVYP